MNRLTIFNCVAHYMPFLLIFFHIVFLTSLLRNHNSKLRSDHDNKINVYPQLVSPYLRSMINVGDISNDLTQ
jgi:hypothetical protein